MAKSKARRRAKKKANKTAIKTVDNTAINRANENANENINENTDDTTDKAVKEKGKNVVKADADRNAKSPAILEVPLTVNGITLTEHYADWLKHVAIHGWSTPPDNTLALALLEFIDLSKCRDDMIALDIGCANGTVGQLVETYLEEEHELQQVPTRIFYMDTIRGFGKQIIKYVSKKFSSIEQPLLTDAKEHFVNADYRLGFEAIIQKFATSKIPRMLEGFDLVTMKDVVHFSSHKTFTKSIEMALTFVRPGGSLLFNLGLHEPDEVVQLGGGFTMGVRTLQNEPKDDGQTIAPPPVVLDEVVWVSKFDLAYCEDQFEKLVGHPFRAWTIHKRLSYDIEKAGENRHVALEETMKRWEEVQRREGTSISKPYHLDVGMRSRMRRRLAREEEKEQSLIASKLGPDVVVETMFFDWLVSITKERRKE